MKWSFMNRSLAVTGSLSVVVLSGVMAMGQAKSPCDPSRVPRTVQGRILNVDRAERRVTLRTPDGATHEFEVSPNTLRDLDVGDHVEATLRSSPRC